MRREVCRAFIDVHKLDKLRVQMRIAEGTVGHQRIIEVSWVLGITLEREEG